MLSMPFRFSTELNLPFAIKSSIGLSFLTPVVISPAGNRFSCPIFSSTVIFDIRLSINWSFVCATDISDINSIKPMNSSFFILIFN